MKQECFSYTSALQLRKIMYQMDKMAERALAEEHQLTLSQFFVLAKIHGGEPCQRDLADSLGITPAAVSRHIATLTELGYVAKTPGETDRRFDSLQLTPTGQTIFRAASKSIDKFFSEQSQSVTHDQYTQISAALAALSCCFDREGAAKAEQKPKKILRPEKLVAGLVVLGTILSFDVIR